MAKRVLAAAVLVLLAVCQVWANDAADVDAVWRRFVEALRRGDYQAAHGLFSAESRSVMPYVEFVEEYGPLSPARELVLARTDGRSARMEDNWAELLFDGVLPATGRRFRIGAAMVKNEDGWGLVAARNERVEHLEAAVRRVMARAVERRDAEFAARLRELAAAEPALQYYAMALKAGALVAEPLIEGLRAFHVGGDGIVRSGSVPSVPPAAPPSPPPLPASPDGYMPELAEPPPLSVFSPPVGEPAEPPPLVPAGPGPSVILPDTIR